MSDEIVSRETSPVVLDGDPVVSRLPELLGESYEGLRRFHEMLQAHGVERGLIGPREVDRIWDRHIINSTSVVPFLKGAGHIVDVGSGAGLPGIVVAVMLPESQVSLVEPMERRCAWLQEVIQELGLANAQVRRGRSEEFKGEILADAVTARAVAAMDKLARWTLPLLRPGGKLVAMKGQRAAAELAEAQSTLQKLGASAATIHEAATVSGFGGTTVVEVIKK